MTLDPDFPVDRSIRYRTRSVRSYDLLISFSTSSRDHPLRYLCSSLPPVPLDPDVRVCVLTELVYEITAQEPGTSEHGDRVP